MHLKDDSNPVVKFKAKAFLLNDERITKVLTTDDYMAIYMLSNQNNIYEWSYNVDHILIHSFSPNEIRKNDMFKSEVLDLNIGTQTLIAKVKTHKMSDQLYILGENINKGMLGQQYLTTPKEIFIGPSNTLSISNQNAENIIDYAIYDKSYIVLLRDNLLYFSGKVDQFYSCIFDTQSRYQSYDLLKPLQLSELRIQKTWLNTLAILMAEDGKMYFWGIHNFKRAVEFVDFPIQIAHIFPLKRDEKIIEYKSSMATKKEYFISNDNRIFTVNYQDFVYSAEHGSVEHIIVEEL